MLRLRAHENGYNGANNNTGGTMVPGMDKIQPSSNATQVHILNDIQKFKVDFFLNAKSTIILYILMSITAVKQHLDRLLTAWEYYII